MTCRQPHQIEDGETRATELAEQRPDGGGQPETSFTDCLAVYPIPKSQQTSARRASERGEREQYVPLAYGTWYCTSLGAGPARLARAG
jgi:hypothetical protein